MTDSGQYTFNKMEQEPKTEEQLLQDKLEQWREQASKLKAQFEEATSKVKFYEKAIKSYNKAFKK